MQRAYGLGNGFSTHLPSPRPLGPSLRVPLGRKTDFCHQQMKILFVHNRLKILTPQSGVRGVASYKGELHSALQEIRQVRQISSKSFLYFSVFSSKESA